MVVDPFVCTSAREANAPIELVIGYHEGGSQRRTIALALRAESSVSMLLRKAAVELGLSESERSELLAVFKRQELRSGGRLSEYGIVNGSMLRVHAAGGGTTKARPEVAYTLEQEVAVAWLVRRTPEGKRFYYNRMTKERVWRRPPAMTAAGQPPAREIGSSIAASCTLDDEHREDEGNQGRSPSHSHAGADSDSGRGIAPDVGDSPDTGTSSGRDGFVMDDEGYWLRTDGLENEYLTVDAGAVPYKHRFVIREDLATAAPVDPKQLHAAVAKLLPLPAILVSRRPRARSTVQVQPEAVAPAAPAIPAIPAIPVAQPPLPPRNSAVTAPPHRLRPSHAPAQRPSAPSSRPQGAPPAPTPAPPMVHVVQQRAKAPPLRSPVAPSLSRRAASTPAALAAPQPQAGGHGGGEDDDDDWL